MKIRPGEEVKKVTGSNSAIDYAFPDSSPESPLPGHRRLELRLHTIGQREKPSPLLVSPTFELALTTSWLTFKGRPDLQTGTCDFGAQY